MTSLI